MLAYLSEKGYVKMLNPKGKGYNIKMVVLTADGSNIHDGYTEDPGVFMDL